MKKEGLVDGINPTGIVVATLRGSDGKIKSRTHHNMVVTAGKQHIADQLTYGSGGGQASMSHMAIGIGQGGGVVTPQALTDTALEGELSRKVFDSKVQGTGGDANKVIYRGIWPSGDGQGAIVEAAIFNALNGGIMLARTTFEVKNKGPSDSLTLTWTLSIN